MSGKCEYACGYPICEYREVYKKAEQMERVNNDNNKM